MNSRERILAVLNRQPVDRLPVDLWYTPEIGAMLRQHSCHNTQPGTPLENILAMIETVRGC